MTPATYAKLQFFNARLNFKGRKSMKNFIRIFLVLALVCGVLLVAQQGTAWASRLQPAPAGVAANMVKQAVIPRAMGTVITTPTEVTTNEPGEYVVGSVVSITLPDTGGQSFTMAIVTENIPPLATGDVLFTPVVKIGSNSTGLTLTVEIKASFPLPPGQTGVAKYWDGKAWVKSDCVADPGMACLVIPVGAPNPTFISLFSA
jgi:hypothetical protein